MYTFIYDICQITFSMRVIINLNICNMTHSFSQLQIGWHRCLRLFVKTFGLVTGVPRFSWDLWLVPFYHLVPLVNPMGRILVRRQSFRSIFHILCHPICTWLYMWHDSLICVTWLTHMCDMTHSYVWHDSLICVTWLTHMCDMTHPYVLRIIPLKPHCNILQHIATHCNTLQRTATHCNTLQLISTFAVMYC